MGSTVKVHIIPAVILEHSEHAVQETSCLSLELPGVEEEMVGGDHSQGDFQAVALIVALVFLHSLPIAQIVPCPGCWPSSVPALRAART